MGLGPKRLVILSYESWGNRLRGATAWSELVNSPDAVSSRPIKKSLGNKQGLGQIVSSSGKKTAKRDSPNYPIFNNSDRAKCNFYCYKLFGRT